MDIMTGIISTNYVTEALGALSKDRAGALMPFGGRYRLIDFPLSNMVNSGVGCIGILSPFKYRSLLDHIGSSKPWMLDKKHGGLFVLPGSSYGINRSHERFLLRDLVFNKSFLKRAESPYVIVSAANFVYNMNYEKMFEAHYQSGADITMLYTIAKADSEFTTSLRLEENRVVGLTKRVKANEPMFMDCFIVGRDFFLKLMDWYAQIDYLDLFEALYPDIQKLHIKGYQFDGYVENIFSVPTYYKCSMDLLKKEVRDELFRSDASIMTKQQDSVPAIQASGSSVKNSLIQAGCYIQGTVENSILFRKVTVEKDAVIKNSIIFKSCHIGSKAHVENAILDKNNQIHPGVTIIGSSNDIHVLPKVEL